MNAEDVRANRIGQINYLRNVVTALKYAKGEFLDNREERRRFIEKHQKYHNPHRTALLGAVGGGGMASVSYLTLASKSPIVGLSMFFTVAAVTIYHVLKDTDRELNFMKLENLGREIRKSKLEMGTGDTSDIPYRQGLDYGNIDFG